MDPVAGRDEATAAGRALPPLVIDLDGTLVKTDLLLETVLAMLRKQPLFVLALPFWLLRGKAYLKHQVARRSFLDIATLPWRTELIAYLIQEKAEGRQLILATGGDVRLAEQVAAHLGLFHLVLATENGVNFAGETKRKELVVRFGEQGFDYVAAGDADDIAVWRSARKAILTSSDGVRQRAAARVTQVEQAFAEHEPEFLEYIEALRPVHWLKNLLVLVPGFLVYRLQDSASLRHAVGAFVSFCFCASAGYLLNDLADLEADRHHPEKRLRSLAAGKLPLTYALLMIPLLLLTGGIAGMAISPVFAAILLSYFVATTIYSFYLKKLVLVDVLLLASLYTLRIVAGAAAMGMWPSRWLVAFSMFLFFSLALVKRYGELVIMRQRDGSGAKARAYELSDSELLAAMGIASGYLAVLVFALHIAIDAPRLQYWRSEPLWLLCPLLLYWISHVWLVAHRGKMPGDPLVFAVTDLPSRIVLFVLVLLALLATHPISSLYGGAA